MIRYNHVHKGSFVDYPFSVDYLGHLLIVENVAHLLKNVTERKNGCFCDISVNWIYEFKIFNIY